ncbi:Hsp20/alpha crystallin family protein [Onchocerca flexuosa]|uniref:Hsp20/alpha crystallin family protein n=2 Tax=Onchocerca flexuosa TaxID=387005 RepID=A0A238BSL3_9BILA|nr:Hsp20/alpha crystallin family protein [Onchocerca flexuosa]
MTTINVNRSESLKRINQWDWPLNKDDGTVNVINTDDKFEVDLEAVYFQPKEIEVKVTGDHLVVRCTRELKEGRFGETKREINRSYKLPSDIDVRTLKSTLTAKGHLIITAEKKK